MEIAELKSLAQYREFLPRVYGGDPFFKDNKSALLPLVCGAHSAFRRASWQQVVAVRQAGTVLCQCVLIQHDAWPEAMQLAFFEALPEAHGAVELLAQHAHAKARERGCRLQVAGLDGHCNYSVGFLHGGPGQPPAFGQAYSPAYYHQYFRALGWEEKRLFSLWEEIPRVKTRVFAAARRLRGGGITFEYGSFGAGFNATMARYTRLCNEIFAGQRYCFLRTPGEDHELFAPMRPLLKRDNLIFAMEGRRAVGLLLWYPDFNDFVPPGQGAGVGAFARYRLLGQAPASLKVVQIGVLPEYRKTGLILQLFGELARCAAGRYPRIPRVTSSWILEENGDSARMSQKILPNRGKEFSAYETPV